MTTFNRPVAFTGTEAQQLINRGTHYWAEDFDEVRCWDCDSKPWHVAADYPCGQQPPRETVTVENPTMGDLHPGLKR